MQTRLAKTLRTTLVAALLCLNCGGSDEAEFRLAKAKSLQGVGKFDRAKQNLQDVISDYPNTEEAHEAKAMLERIKEDMLNHAYQLMDEGSVAEAEELCGQIITEFPGTKESEDADGLLILMRERLRRAD